MLCGNTPRSFIMSSSHSTSASVLSSCTRSFLAAASMNLSGLPWNPSVPPLTSRHRRVQRLVVR